MVHGDGDAMTPARDRSVAIALTAATLAALLARIGGLGDGLWYDEIRTVLLSVRSPVATIVTGFPSNNQHTLYSLLAHASVAAFGEQAWSLRLPAMVLGVACVPMLYLCAREFTGRWEALAAAALLAVDYHHVWFSQNARGYSTLAFLALLTTFLLLRGLRRGRWSDFAWYGVAAALGTYTHLTMVFLVASHALLCVVPAASPQLDRSVPGWWRRPLLGVSLAGFLTLLLYLPMLLQVQAFFVERPSPMLVATPRWAVLELVRGLGIGVGTGLWAALRIALIGVGLLSYLRQSRFVTGLFVLPGILTVAAAVVLQRPVFPRFLFFLIGFAMLALVRGTVVASQRLFPSRVGARSAALAALVVASLAALAPNYRHPKQDFGGALRYVESQRAEGEPVATVGLTRIVYREYYGRPWTVLTSLEDLEALRAGGRAAWVLYTLEGYIGSTMPDVLEALHRDCAVAAVFRGTLRNGDVTVCRIAARRAGGVL